MHNKHHQETVLLLDMAKSMCENLIEVTKSTSEDLERSGKEMSPKEQVLKEEIKIIYSRILLLL